jgi:rpsU-divergently transcribed protein
MIGTFSDRNVCGASSPVLLLWARRALATAAASTSSGGPPSVDDRDYDADAESDSLTDDERRRRNRRVTSSSTAKKKSPSAATTAAEKKEQDETPSSSSSSSSSFAFSSSSWPGSDVEDEDDASRGFESDDDGEEEEQDASSQLRERLFETALAGGHVERHGWSNEALSSAARSLGFSPSAARLARRGPADLALWFIRKCNDEFRDSLGEGFSVDDAKGGNDGGEGREASTTTTTTTTTTTNPRVEELASLPGTTARIEAAIWWRLQPLLPHSGTWHQAAASVALAGPRAAAEAARELWRFCDDAWTLAAGDREPATSSTASSSYYTKRATLAAVYAACELHLLADYSPGHEETRRSIRRRLGDAAAVAKATKSLLPGSSSNPLASLASEAASRAREAACGPVRDARRRREGAAYYSER